MMREPIAIVGLACRFPGAGDANAYWRLLDEGRDAVTEIPASRWNIEDLYEPVPGKIGKMSSRFGGFLDDVDRFDAAFFGITPREARAMDPQQRLMLEIAWEALEDAGAVASSLSGSRTGVFLGATTWDYNKIANTDVRFMDAHASTGTVLCILANRLSYLLNLRGPSMAVDTACSSSLTAVHLACSSLRSGECSLAIAGGVNLILSPETTIVLSQARMLSPDGRCKAFDETANGYVRSEGCGILVLKRASDARRDGDRIHALIRGTAINQDGLSNGLSAPNGLAQQDVIRTALENAGVAENAIGYVETHGTGTTLGDPIEVAALVAVLGADRPSDRPCGLGSVKTNIGHTEAAAGMAGLIKVVLSMQHATIPRHIHLTSLNPKVRALMAQTPFYIPTEARPWASETPRLASVSSFGFGGANAHVVLEESPSEPPTSQNVDDRASLLPLSAKDPRALRALATRFAAFLRGTPESFRDICFTAGARRTHHAHRLAVTARSKDEAAEALDILAARETETRPALRRPKVVFVFSGQGSQWSGMGRALQEHQGEPVFREAIERCAAAMKPYFDAPLGELLSRELPEAESLDPARVQPMLFAMQVGLAALWASWGVKPDAVVGHSMGEVAAAYVAGALSLEDAARVICIRSRLVGRTSGQGGVLSVELSRTDTETLLAHYEGRLSVAASNGPTTTLVSGDRTALSDLQGVLERRDVFARTVKVDYASHSAQMDPIRAELLAQLATVRPRAPEVPFASTTVLGTEVPRLDAAYWWKNLRQPVLFAERVGALREGGWSTYVEISPHPVLTSALQAIVPNGTVAGTLRRQEEPRACMLQTLGALHSRGYPVSFAALSAPGARHASLPSYPWQRERYWLGGDEPLPAGPRPAERAAKATEGCLFEVAWTKDETPGVPMPHGTWLVLDDGDGDALCREVRARGDHCIRVHSDDAAGVARVLHDATFPIVAIVFLSGYDCGAVLRGVQAIAGKEWDEPPRLWIVTRGVSGLDGSSPVDVLAASIWGMGLTIARELPEFRCTLLDLDHDAGSESVYGEIARSAGEERIALRRGVPHVARLRAFSPGGEKAFAGIRPDATYVLSGGLGSLGLLVAQWLIDRGARHLVLLGRSAPTEDAQRALSEWRSRGAAVRVASVDVSDFDAVERLFAQWRPEMPPVRGVFHLAAALEDGTLLHLTADHFSGPAFTSKALGAWNLHRATEHLDLDSFVLFSSASSVFGAPGIANYAAANASLDALAKMRRGCGLPAVSINWGPWAGQGFAAAKHREDRLAAQGIGSLSPREALACLEEILRSNASNVIAARFARRSASLRGPLARFVEHLETGANAPAPTVVDMASIEPSQRLHHLQGMVCARIARSTDLSASRIPTHETFYGLGMDSLLLLELRNGLEADLGLYVPMTILARHPTPESLAGYLLSKIDPTPTPTCAPGSRAVRTMARPKARLRLFCFPAAGESAFSFRHWHSALPDWVDVCAIQPPGREARAGEAPCTSMAELLDDVAQGIDGELDRPFALFGTSFGSLVAYETALRIHRDRGIWPRKFFVAAFPPPALVRQMKSEISEREWLDRLVPGTPEQDESLSVLAADVHVGFTWDRTVDHRLGCAITAFEGAQDHITRVSLEGWQDYSGGAFTRKVLPGGHMFTQTHEREFLASLREEVENDDIE